MTPVWRLARDLIRDDGAARDVPLDVGVATWIDLLGLLSPALHPYLHFALAGTPAIDAVPEDVREALDAAHQAAILNELRRRSVLRNALSTLETRGIDTVLLKGAAIAHSTYPEPHLRPMTDIDVWVESRELANAARCLLENGFEVPEGGLSEGRLSPAIAQRRLRATGTGVLLELHGPVRSLQCLSREWVARCWGRSVPLRVQALRSKTLSPEDALVHTCLHLAMTNRFANSQVGLLDVALLIDRWGQTIDWVGLARDAREQQIAAFLTIALTIARAVWDARVPDHFFTAIGEVRNLCEMEALALEQVWERRAELPSALERVFREPRGTARLAAVIERVTTHPWRPSLGETHTRRHTAWHALDQLRSDLTVKIPAYVRAWSRGDLALGELRRRARLAAGRGRIALLASAAEAQLHDAHR